MAEYSMTSSGMSEDYLKFWNYILNRMQINTYYKVYIINTTPTYTAINNLYTKYAQTLPVYKQEVVQKHQETDSNLKKLIKQASEQIAEVVQQRVCLI